MNNQLETMGYIPMTTTEFNKLEQDETDYTLNKMYSNEKFKMNYSFDNVDYNLIDVKKITIDSDGLCDMIFEDKNINLSFLDWYYSKDYIKGIEWYRKEYAHLPMIEEMAYLFVKADIKGSARLKIDKYEIHQLKQEHKKREKLEAQKLKEEKQLIRKYKKEQSKKITFTKQDTTISFNK